jgi:Enoyl-(Acyl carrier protein) reductase
MIERDGVLSPALRRRSRQNSGPRGLVVDDLPSAAAVINRNDIHVDFTLDQVVPAGRSWDAELKMMPLQQILERSAAEWPDNPALDFMNKRISYRDQSDLSAPGYFPSKVTDAIPGEESEVIEGNTPMRRWGRPEDMAGAALYLASRAGGFVCGSTVVVDGGLATTG